MTRLRRLRGGRNEPRPTYKVREKRAKCYIFAAKRKERKSSLNVLDFETCSYGLLDVLFFALPIIVGTVKYLILSPKLGFSASPSAADTPTYPPQEPSAPGNVYHRYTLVVA
ncbi:uncharacterized [Tachysurus ichikawai]